MKTAIVNFKDITNTEENPTLCLSAARYVGGCYHCRIFRHAYVRNHQNLEETSKELVCKPNITEETINSLENLKTLYEEKRQLKARIAEIEGEL